MYRTNIENLEAPFTKEELEILRGKYPSLAKTLNTSDTYLKQIANGLRVIKSSKSKKCYKKLKETIDFFSASATQSSFKVEKKDSSLQKKEDNYVLCANELSISLYKKSREALMKSSCYDFFVYENPKDTDYKEWETSLKIDEETYFLLYYNLCDKYRKYVATPIYLKNKK